MPPAGIEPATFWFVAQHPNISLGSTMPKHVGVFKNYVQFVILLCTFVGKHDWLIDWLIAVRLVYFHVLLWEYQFWFMPFWFTPVLFMPTFSGTQVGHKTRPWFIVKLFLCKIKVLLDVVLCSLADQYQPFGGTCISIYRVKRSGGTGFLCNTGNSLLKHMASHLRSLILTLITVRI